VHLFAFIIRIYHDARSPERQIRKHTVMIYFSVYQYLQGGTIKTSGKPLSGPGFNTRTFRIWIRSNFASPATLFMNFLIWRNKSLATYCKLCRHSATPTSQQCILNQTAQFVLTDFSQVHSQIQWWLKGELETKRTYSLRVWRWYTSAHWDWEKWQTPSNRTTVKRMCWPCRRRDFLLQFFFFLFFFFPPETRLRPAWLSETVKTNTSNLRSLMTWGFYREKTNQKKKDKPTKNIAKHEN